MFKIVERYTNAEPGFSLTIQNPSEHDCNEKKKYNLFNLKVWKYSIWAYVPQFFKPVEKWVDTSKYEWSKPKADGRYGYVEEIPRHYGFSFVKDSGVHVYYGIQPGCFKSNDPKNSDHVKIFNYFWNWHHVRHDAYDIEGNYLCRGSYFREWQHQKNSKPFNKETRDVDFQTVAWFTLPKDPNFEPKGFFGPYDNFSEVQTSVEVYEFFEYQDPYDKTKTIARCNIEEREWVRGSWGWLRAILKYVPGCRAIKREIEIQFRDEVGKEKGSWKGGVVGTSFEMLPGETMTQCWERFCNDRSAKWAKGL